MKKISKIAVAFAIAFCLAGTFAYAYEEYEDDDSKGWKSWGYDLNNSKFAKGEKKITSANVGNLGVKWVFDAGLYNGNNCAVQDCSMSATPTVEDDTLFIPDWAGNLYAIYTATGIAKWSTKVSSYTGVTNDYSRTSPTIHGNKIIIGSKKSAVVIAVNKTTGQLLWKSPVLDPHPAASVTASVVTFGNKVFVGITSNEEGFAANPVYPCCSFRGSLVALDANTGAVLWQTYMIPSAIGQPSEWFSGAAVWGNGFSIDPKRKAIFITTGNNYNTPANLKACIIAAGADPVAIGQCVATYDSKQNYVDSILSLNINTGKVNWVTKLAAYDAWNVGCGLGYIPPNGNCPDPKGEDFDFGQAPMLWTINATGTDSKKKDLVGAGQKSGIFWALDRDTGSIVWYTPVGIGTAIGGMQWGSATDGKTIFTTSTYADADGNGAWSALDAATGAFKWRTVAPGVPPQYGIKNFIQATVTGTNDVVFGSSMGPGIPNMFAMNAATGQILWNFTTAGSVNAGPSIYKGTVYWPSGYVSFGLGVKNQYLYAFEVK